MPAPPAVTYVIQSQTNPATLPATQSRPAHLAYATATPLGNRSDEVKNSSRPIAHTQSRQTSPPSPVKHEQKIRKPSRWEALLNQLNLPSDLYGAPGRIRLCGLLFRSKLFPDQHQGQRHRNSEDFTVLFSLLETISANGSPDALDKVRLSLEATSAGWFNLVKWAGYAVALGCAMEAPETFIIIRRWWFLRFRNVDCEETKEDRKSWRTPLAAVGLIVIVAGIVLETFGESKVSDADALLRTHESEKLSAAEEEAASATRDAGTARSSAITAAAASSDAKTSSNNAAAASLKAISASGDAVTTAADARKEADSYAQEIADAKQEAANAASHLAEAEKRLAESTEREAAAEAKLAAIKAPRSLVNVMSLIATLKALKGTEYTLNVFQDDESIQFTKSLDEVLREAGWVRKQKGTYRLGVASFNIFRGDDAPNHDESVPVCVETGIQIHVRSTKSLQSLLAMSTTDLPSNIQNAATLLRALQGSIAPAEEHNVGETLILDEANPGEGPMVICVGKKP